MKLRMKLKKKFVKEVIRVAGVTTLDEAVDVALRLAIRVREQEKQSERFHVIRKFQSSVLRSAEEAARAKDKNPSRISQDDVVPRRSRKRKP